MPTSMSAGVRLVGHALLVLLWVLCTLGLCVFQLLTLFFEYLLVRPPIRRVGVRPAGAASISWDSGDLLPGLPNHLVVCHIWPRLPCTPVMLWTMRRVCRSWRDFLAARLVWQALEVMQLNNADYLRRCHVTGQPRESLQERLNFEISVLALAMCQGSVAVSGDP
ncbi:hypothetical protein R1sor_014829 [Riccia sorocarpa]|uniref:F-box domain-containing protein n=1 Tax=Riccia sorocarpa TaxID=122646 RepID=A0ABD3HEB9_9MARC